MVGQQKDPLGKPRLPYLVVSVFLGGTISPLVTWICLLGGLEKKQEILLPYQMVVFHRDESHGRIRQKKHIQQTKAYKWIIF